MSDVSEALWLIPESDASVARFVLFFSFGCVLLLGVVFNLFVVYRTQKLARKDRHQFFNGTGVFLFVMAVSDMTSLITLFSQLMTALSVSNMDSSVMQFICKGSEYVGRLVYTQSMYCWLCMSGLRYLAAIHPLEYSTVVRNPLIAIFSVFFFSSILNLHQLVSVQGDTEEACQFSLQATSTMYDMVDVIFSFVVPFSFILWLDMRVLCGSNSRRTSDPLLQVVFHKVDEETEKNRLSNMRKFMTITFISLVLTVPETMIKVTRILFSPHVEIPYHIFQMARFVYYLKFSFNAFYLTAYVFDRNVLSKASSSRQLSLSIRRLEENNPSIIPRERSNTVSYRATTPVPVLTRNSSCIILDSALDSPRQWV